MEAAPTSDVEALALAVLLDCADETALRDARDELRRPAARADDPDRYHAAADLLGEAAERPSARRAV